MSKRPSHSATTQEGRNRFDKPPAELIPLSDEEEAQVALYRRLNYFPTPPWAVRAIIERLSGRVCGEAVLPFSGGHVLDPAAGRLHLVRPLRDFGFTVDHADIHDHGVGSRVEDFLTADYGDGRFDAVVMNPPFSGDETPNQLSIADKFVAKALTLADDVLVFGRLAFMTPGKRYPLMRDHLEAIYVFCERVPIALGRITEKSGATDYAWFHFRAECDELSDPPVRFLPPGTRDRNMRPGDGWI